MSSPASGSEAVGSKLMATASSVPARVGRLTRNRTIRFPSPARAPPFAAFEELRYLDGSLSPMSFTNKYQHSQGRVSKGESDIPSFRPDLISTAVVDSRWLQYGARKIWKYPALLKSSVDDTFDPVRSTQRTYSS